MNMRDIMNRIVEAANAAVRFVPDQDNSDRWFVFVGDENVGTMRKSYRNSRRDSRGGSVGYEASVRYDGRSLRTKHPRMAELKKEVQAFIAGSDAAAP